MNTIIIFGTKKGCTKECAEKLAEEIQADLMNIKNINRFVSNFKEFSHV